MTNKFKGKNVIFAGGITESGINTLINGREFAVHEKVNIKKKKEKEGIRWNCGRN